MAEKYRLREADLDEDGIQIKDKQLVIVGGPAIDRQQRLIERGDTTVVSTLDDLESVSTRETIVLDDFYDIYRTALATGEAGPDSDLGEILESRGTCLATDPRSFDWLLMHTPLDNDYDITEDYDLRPFLYDRKEGIAYCAVEYELSEESLREHEAELTYSYQYRSQPLRTHPAATDGGYETYLPFLVPQLSVFDTEEGWLFSTVVDRVRKTVQRLPENAVATGKELAEQEVGAFAAGGFLQALKHEFGETIGAVTLDEVADAVTVREFPSLARESPLLNLLPDVGGPAAVAGMFVSGLPAGPAAAAMLLVVWRHLGHDEGYAEIQEYFGQLLSDQLLPHTQAELEEALGLPPKTLIKLGKCLEEDNFQQLDAFLYRMRADHSGATAAFETRLEDLESEFRDAIEDLESTVAELDGRLKRVEAFVSPAVKDACTGLWTIRNRLEDAETTLLRVDEVDIKEIPYVVPGGADGDPFTPIDDIVGAADGSGVVVLEGPHGTGKTTAGYHACRALETDGEYTIQHRDGAFTVPAPDRDYVVRVPNFEPGTAFVRHNLSATERNIVYTSFTIGPAAFDSLGELKALLRWVGEDRCDLLVIECRDEFRAQLEDYATNATTGDTLPPAAADAWADRTRVRFDRLTADEDIEAIVRGVFDLQSVESGPSDEIVSTVVDRAYGNPEIAKLIAGLEATGGPSFDDEEVETFDDLVWHDVKNVFTEKASQHVPLLFEYLAALRTAETDALTALLNTTRGTLRTSGGQIRGYLGGDIHKLAKARDEIPSLGGEEQWELRPSLYADVVFRQRGLEAGHFFDYVSAIDETGQYMQCDQLTESLTIAYDAAGTWCHERVRERVVDTSEQFVRDMHRLGMPDEQLFRVLRQLAFADIPVAAAVVDDLAAPIVRGAAADAAEYSSSQSEMAANVLAQLAVNQYVVGDPEAAHKLVHQSSTLASATNASAVFDDPPAFERTVAAMTVGLLPTVAIEDPVDRFYDLDAAIHDPDTDSEPTELKNFYKDAVAYVASNTAPSEGGTFVDAILSHAREAVDSDDGADEFAPGPIADLYSMILAGLPQVQSAAAAEPWVEYLGERAAEATDDPEQNLDIVEESFAYGLLRLATIRPPREVWVRLFIDKTVITGFEHFDLEATSELLSTVHGTAISSIVEQSVDDDEAWVQALLDSLARTVDHFEQIDARSAGLNPELFRTNAYANALGNIACQQSFEVARPWFDSLLEDAATRDSAGNVLPPVYHVAVANLADWTDLETATPYVRYLLTDARTRLRETESSSEGFEDIVAKMLYRVSDGSTPRRRGDWLSTIVDLLAEIGTVGEVQTVYILYLVNAVNRAEPSVEWVVWVIDDIQERTVFSEDPLGESPEQRVDLLSSVITNAIYLLWVDANGSFDSEEMDQALNAFSRIEDVDSTMYSDLIETIAAGFSEYVEEHPSLASDWRARFNS